MGRPRKDDAAKRDDQLNLRLTRPERLAIEANAAFLGITATEYVRRAALSRRMPASQVDRQATAARAAALLGACNNLNQLTRHANAGKGLLETEIMTTLARINGELDQLYDPAPR